ncbi:hypothetical protein POM88_025160 [Heracleum sosnowskyi]|uniref:Uncharacterized protein n=1 Tax=Heracleum sosnowskyi TaxID=360622 RepID=A0AAD8I4D8_9APIA|nr:hypothetical protein POM88_025160 [Heracleum sosnowskyi]
MRYRSLIWVFSLDLGFCFGISVWGFDLGFIFSPYLDKQLGWLLKTRNIDRCRKLYEKYLEWSPENFYAWSQYAELERSLSEIERARAFFELSIAQLALDTRIVMEGQGTWVKILRKHFQE